MGSQRVGQWLNNSNNAEEGTKTLPRRIIKPQLFRLPKSLKSSLVQHILFLGKLCGTADPKWMGALAKITQVVIFLSSHQQELCRNWDFYPTCKLTSQHVWLSQMLAEVKRLLVQKQKSSFLMAVIEARASAFPCAGQFTKLQSLWGDLTRTGWQLHVQQRNTKFRESSSFIMGHKHDYPLLYGHSPDFQTILVKAVQKADSAPLPAGCAGTSETPRICFQQHPFYIVWAFGTLLWVHHSVSHW